MPPPRRSPRHVRCLALAVGLAGLVAGACGKKGPPLAPFSKVPGAPQEVTIRRKGDLVEARFKVPAANSDGRQPARIDSVALYALTGPGKGVNTPLFLKHAEPVATALVREPPPPPPDLKEGEPPPPPPPPRTDPGLDQGEAAVLVDALTPASLVPETFEELEKAQKRDEEARRKNPPPEPRVAPPDLGPPIEPLPARFYAVAGLNGKHKGAFSQLARVPIDAPPPSPAAPEATVAEGRIEVGWTPPDGLRRPVLPGSIPPPQAPGPSSPGLAGPPPVPAGGQAEPEEGAGQPAPDQQPAVPAPASPSPAVTPSLEAAPAPVPAGEGAAPGQEPTGPVGPLPARLLSSFPVTLYTYAVYETAPPDFKPQPVQPGALPPYPVQLTQPPVSATTWSDTRFVVGSTHCYAVATVATTGQVIVESAPSPSTCVTTEDTFPPAAPKGLAAVASEGAISLIWDANTEPDLAGYIVLRGRAGGTLTPLTRAPIAETTYRDATVTRGVRYVYAVVAVDKAKPPNVSSQSNLAEETAR